MELKLREVMAKGASDTPRCEKKKATIRGIVAR